MTRLMFAVIEIKDEDNPVDQADMALYLDGVASRGRSPFAPDYEYTVYEKLEDLTADIADGVFEVDWDPHRTGGQP